MSGKQDSEGPLRVADTSNLALRAVLYPRVDDYRFDEKYYKEVHMPLVEKK